MKNKKQNAAEVKAQDRRLKRDRDEAFRDTKLRHDPGWKVEVLNKFAEMFGPYGLPELTIIGDHFDLFSKKLPARPDHAAHILGALIIKVHLEVMGKGRT